MQLQLPLWKKKAARLNDISLHQICAAAEVAACELANHEPQQLAQVTAEV